MIAAMLGAVIVVVLAVVGATWKLALMLSTIRLEIADMRLEMERGRADTLDLAREIVAAEIARCRATCPYAIDPVVH